MVVISHVAMNMILVGSVIFFYAVSSLPKDGRLTDGSKFVIP